MKTLKIYLAGRMSGLSFEKMNSWRSDMANLVKCIADDIVNCNVNVINPVTYYNFQNPRHQNEREIMQYDLNHVKSSDIVIVKLEELNSSIGSCIELYEAYKKNIPVLALGTRGEFEILHPWVKECITRREETKEDIVTYISDFYML